MTQKKATAAAQNKPKAPDYIAWNVVQNGDKSFWNRVGAAWNHADHRGVSITLEQIPVDGRIVLRTPMDNARGA